MLSALATTSQYCPRTVTSHACRISYRRCQQNQHLDIIAPCYWLMAYHGK